MNPVKREYVAPEDDGLFDKPNDAYYSDFKAAQQTVGKQDRADAVKALKESDL